MKRLKRWLAVLCLSLATFAAGACGMAGTRGPEASAPRPNQPQYPITLAASEDRRKSALDAWTSLARAQGITQVVEPELQNVTATLRRLPALAAPLRLPNVTLAETTNARGDRGNVAAQTLTSEEALHESLRRFLLSAAPLLGVEPEYVSLVSIKDAAAGTRQALYEQKPFLYPLRGGYGRIEITFTNDGRVIALTSTALPDAKRIRAALELPRERLTPQQIATKLAGTSVAYTDANGAQQTRSIPNAEAVNVRELVVLPVASADASDALDIHLAWEVFIEGVESQAIYVDAVTGEILRAGTLDS